ncbi:Uncharacterized protein CCMA1212_004993 [Trichoderma ghanense]|uniref:Copper acquisition factor BIM1-like domain-containing protein n=1 Tax=Trichoderma ghanense TaxID=65468 RepID=A0ABY2H542_9HYPO
MALKSLLLGLAAIQAVTAHFAIEYPEWRADTLAEENEDKYSQWDYPCTSSPHSHPPSSPLHEPHHHNANANTKKIFHITGGGVPYKAGNITNWPLSGGALQLELHHPWTYLFVNLGLGANTTNFNISLTPSLVNVTGKGTLCIDKLALPSLDAGADIKEGTLASIQVVTSGESGSALYNCADIRFTKNATGPSNCSTSEGLEMHTVTEEDENDNDNGTDSSKGGDSGNSSAPADKKNAAGLMGSDKSVLATVVGLAVAFSLGLGL